MIGRNKGYCESNAEQYTFFTVQDVPGVAKLMGGFDKYADAWNADFQKAEPSKFSFAEGEFGSEGPINYANEPNMQAAHLFNYAGRPWLSQYWVAHSPGTGLWPGRCGRRVCVGRRGPRATGGPQFVDGHRAVFAAGRLRKPADL